ncbi:hypothetical protein GCM10009801_34170 [Streptomyces albiaxialis]|uniref:Secreted protein n=1 Tax=Streptomyces albiaxialis TaxID=329523 RepID=A0ABP5HIU0_9ACTN
MKYTRHFTALAATAAVFALAVPTAQAVGKQDVSVQAGQARAIVKDGGNEWGHGYFDPDGDKFFASDYTDPGGWRIKARLQKKTGGTWRTVATCTARDSGGRECSQNIAEGTRVRVKAWAYKGSDTAHGTSWKYTNA